MRHVHRRSGFLAVPAAALLLLSGCGGGGGMTDPDTGDLTLSRVSGDQQAEATGDSVPEPFVVEVTRDGAGVSGETVSWSVTDSAGPGAALRRASGTTDGQGRASTRLSLGDAAGEYTVEATLESTASSVAFSATAEVPRVDDVATDGGDGQSGTVSSSLPDSLVAQVLDQFGDPLADEQVEFAVVRGESAGAAVDPATDQSDADGEAATSVTLGSKNGTYRVAAVAGTDSVVFSAEATGGTESLLAVDSVRPSPLKAGASATVFGSGFSASASDNQVSVDGSSTAVTAATETELELTVPTFTDECLPRRGVDVEVTVVSESASPVTAELEPVPAALSLAAGEDTLLAAPAEVGCVQLPGFTAGGAEYEVAVTPVPQTLGFNSMQLAVNGHSPGSTSDVAGARVARGLRGPRPLTARGRLARWRQYEFERRLRERERRLLPRIRARAARAPSMSRTMRSRIAAAVASVGDSATFNVSCTFQPDVRAVARSVSDAAVIYEDTVMASEGVGFSDAQYDSIAARFDTVLFATDTTYFGSPADIDNNGRVIMLFTTAVNALTTGNYSDGFTAGFFCGTDLLDASQSGGNEAEMFYLVSPDPDGEFNGGGGSLSESTVRRRIEGTVIHEFQHLINAQIGGGSGPQTNNSGGANDVWINEGLSHLAEEVGGHAVAGNDPGQELTGGDLLADIDAVNTFYLANFRNLSTYLGSPADTAALVNAIDPGVSGTFRMRGAAWSFVRWLLDRFADPGTETELTRALIQATAPDGRAAVVDAVEAVSGQDVTFEELVAEWSAMFSVEDRPSLPAQPRAGLTLPSYRLRDVYGSDAAFSVQSGAGYPLDAAVTEVGLSADTDVPADLFTATARYVRLISSQESTGTGLRLEAPDGSDLSSGVAPRLLIVRTK